MVFLDVLPQSINCLAVLSAHLARMSAADENEADLRTQESLCCVGVTAKRQKKRKDKKTMMLRRQESLGRCGGNSRLTNIGRGARMTQAGHGVAQYGPQPTAPYHATPYHNSPYHIISYHTTTHHTILYHTTTYLHNIPTQHNLPHGAPYSSNLG